MGSKNMRVMVVDDEKVVRDFFKRCLSFKGIEVVGAASGDEAIALAKEDDFDVYFVDMRMPGMDGLETSRLLRKADPGATVVMITGYAMYDMIQRMEKMGFAVLCKPFDIEEIKKAVSSVREKRNGERRS